MASDKIIKTRCFSFEDTGLEQIKNKLAQLNGIESVATVTNKLSVTYDLRQTNYQQINKHLSKTTAIKKESQLNKLHSSFISFCEQNEINHINSATSWGYYVQNLYLSLHHDNRH